MPAPACDRAGPDRNGPRNAAHRAYLFTITAEGAAPLRSLTHTTRHPLEGSLPAPLG